MSARKKWTSLFALVMIASMVLSACAPPTPEIIEKEVLVEKPVVQTVIVEKEVLVEKPVVETVVVEKEVPVEKVVKETVEVVVEKEVIVEVTPEPVAEALPRNETLYFNGQQWGPVVGWNPYSSSMNNAMAIAQQDNVRVIMFESPYLYNMLDGKSYPLLADGDYVWNDAMTEITFKIKPAAHWSDGTPVTADDVAYTWASNIKYSTNAGNNFKDYIDTIEAVDAQTVVVKAKLDANGKTVNPLQVPAYLTGNYVVQKAWTQTLEERTGGDSTQFMADTAEDVVYSRPVSQVLR